MSAPAHRGATAGHIILGALSAVLLVFYLIPSRFLLRWLWHYNQYIAPKTGVRITMIGLSSVGHVVLFTAMTMVTLRFTRMRLWAVAAMLGGGAMLIELAQRWIPSRSCSLKDLGFNFLGIAIGISLSSLLCVLKLGEGCDKIAVQEDTEGKEQSQ